MFYRIEGNTGDFTFYIFMRAKKTVGENRVGEDKEKKENKELSLGERRKRGRERRYGWWWHEGEWRQFGGKHKERRKK